MTAAVFELSAMPLADWSGVDVFWLICLVYVVWTVWQGWRAGLFRELSVVAGLIAGWLIGLSHGPALFARLWSGKALPAFISVPLSSLVLGLIVYIIALAAGRVLFKRACDHSFGPTRLILGGGGALVGLGLSLFGVWIFVVLVRFAGSIFQGPVDDSIAQGQAAAASAWTPREAKRRKAAADRLAESDPSVFVRIKHSAESGLLGEVVRFTDPFSPEAYTDTNKVALIVADPELQERLLEAPSLREIALEPKVAALRQDPRIGDAFQRRDYLSLLQDPRILAVLRDPALERRLEKVDITRLLNETVSPGR